MTGGGMNLRFFRTENKKNGLVLSASHPNSPIPSFSPKEGSCFV